MIRLCLILVVYISEEERITAVSLPGMRSCSESGLFRFHFDPIGPGTRTDSG